MSFEDSLIHVKDEIFENDVGINYVINQISIPKVKQFCEIARDYIKDFDIFVGVVREFFKLNIEIDKLHLIDQYTDCNNFLVYVILKDCGLKKAFPYLNEKQRILNIIIGSLEEIYIPFESILLSYSSIKELIDLGILLKKYEDLKKKRLEDKSTSLALTLENDE